MRVVIIGAGRVGTAIADSPDAPHDVVSDVVVIDVDEAHTEESTHEFHVTTPAGDGISQSVLKADVGVADMLVVSAAIATLDDVGFGIGSLGPFGSHLQCSRLLEASDGVPGGDRPAGDRPPSRRRSPGRPAIKAGGRTAAPARTRARE
ncbi:hypothetical protein BRD05_01425 [Halobacteriales archaeon QS_9_70_65]|nr:MAG: hypothetical protein BRD05_01425 [Halobacteriales archaeon QS_9_70_65]